MSLLRGVLPGGGSVRSVAAQAVRMDGQSGLVLIANGVPLPPGLLMPADLPHVRIEVGGVEQAVALKPLSGHYQDGSCRSLGVQFLIHLTHDTPVTAVVRFGAGPRSQPDRVYETVTYKQGGATNARVKNKAVLLPTDPAYLCSTQVTLSPLSVAAEDTGVAVAWQAEAEARWSGSVASGANAGTAIYDHPTGLWALWCRTGNRRWFHEAYDWALLCDGDQKHDLLSLLPYTLGSTGGCASEAIWNPEGLRGSNGSCGATNEQYSLRMRSMPTAYWLSAWEQPRLAVAYGANRALYHANYAAAKAAWINHTYTHRFNVGATSLQCALYGYLLEITTAFSTPGGYPGGVFDYPTRLPWWIDALEEYAYDLGDYRDGLVGQRDTATNGGTMGAGTVINFQTAVVADLIMLYYEQIAPDARLPGMLRTHADYMISQSRASASGEPGYPHSWCHPYQSRFPVPASGCTPWTLPMFANLFGWCWAFTGDPTYQTWLDRSIAVANVAGNHLTMQTKIWGETWGGSRLSALYYRNGGKVRAPAGAYPVAIRPIALGGGL